MPGPGRAQLYRGLRCPTAIVGKAITGLIGRKRDVVQQHSVSLMIQCDEYYIIRTTIKVRMKKTHDSPHVQHTHGFDLRRDQEPHLSDPSLLDDQREQVVLIVETRRSNLMSLPTHVE